MDPVTAITLVLCKYPTTICVRASLIAVTKTHVFGQNQRALSAGVWAFEPGTRAPRRLNRSYRPRVDYPSGSPSRRLMMTCGRSGTNASTASVTMALIAIRALKRTWY